jgi:hypothetical protein
VIHRSPWTRVRQPRSRADVTSRLPKCSHVSAHGGPQLDGGPPPPLDELPVSVVVVSTPSVVPGPLVVVEVVDELDEVEPVVVPVVGAPESVPSLPVPLSASVDVPGG